MAGAENGEAESSVAASQQGLETRRPHQVGGFFFARKQAMNEPPSVVLKFGGTSVQDAAAIRRLIHVVAAESRRRVVVVSALATVTDELCRLAASPVGTKTAGEALERLCARHVGLVREVVDADRQSALIGRLDTLFRAAGDLASRPHERGMLARRDQLLALGELASSAVLAEALVSAGLAASWVDARRVIATDDSFGAARPDPAAIARATRRVLPPLLGSGVIPVLGGFIGAAPDGATTTLGRGGSDYSAALVAAALPAEEVQIWTDVDGVLTADPRIVTYAQRIPRLSFDEAYEMARFGARVLHWGTLEPAAAHGIPVRVLDPRRPGSDGTLISAPDGARGPAIAGLAHQSGVTVADVRARGVAGSRRFLATALAWLDCDGRPATVLALSQSRAIVSSPDPRLIERFVAGLPDAAEAQVSHDAALIAVVGDNIAAHPRAWRELGAALDAGRLTCVMPSQSGHALVSVRASGGAAAVIAHLHDRLVVPGAMRPCAAAGACS